jgi:peptide/nickel transport system permease protein
MATVWAVWRRCSASLKIGIAILFGAVCLAVVGAVALPDPNHQELASAYSAPGSAGHILGTDPLGRDVLSWIAASIRTSFIVCAGVVLLSATVGTAIGLAAGYAGGVIDAVLMRLVDLQLAVPPLLLFIAASATISVNTLSLILLLSVTSWVPYARVIRTQVRVETNRASVAAARLAGVGPIRILIRHLLPAAIGLLLVVASLQIGFVLLWEVGLSFVGLGIQPPSASLGFIMAQGRSSLAEAWWIVVLPGVALALLLLAANLIGDGLQELFDVDADLMGR